MMLTTVAMHADRADLLGLLDSEVAATLPSIENLRAEWTGGGSAQAGAAPDWLETYAAMGSSRGSPAVATAIAAWVDQTRSGPTDSSASYRLRIFDVPAPMHRSSRAYFQALCDVANHLDAPVVAAFIGSDPARLASFLEARHLVARTREEFLQVLDQQLGVLERVDPSPCLAKIAAIAAPVAQYDMSEPHDLATLRKAVEAMCRCRNAPMDQWVEALSTVLLAPRASVTALTGRAADEFIDICLSFLERAPAEAVAALGIERPLIRYYGQPSIADVLARQMGFCSTSVRASSKPRLQVFLSPVGDEPFVPGRPRPFDRPR